MKYGAVMPSPFEKSGNREYTPASGSTTYHPASWAIIPKTQVTRMPHKI